MAKVEMSLIGKRIFVIDDNELLRGALKERFELRGATVYVSSTTERTATILQGLSAQGLVPDLIVADIRLPGCFGVHLLQVISDSVNKSFVPIVVASRWFNQLALAKMKLFGVMGYVEKPVKMEELFKFSLDILMDSIEMKLTAEKDLAS